MSDFSDLLSKYIQEKNIQVASMVKYCGIDRSAMYKIIKGKHHPPLYRSEIKWPASCI